MNLDSVVSEEISILVGDQICNMTIVAENSVSVSIYDVKSE